MLRPRLTYATALVLGSLYFVACSSDSNQDSSGNGTGGSDPGTGGDSGTGGADPGTGGTDTGDAGSGNDPTGGSGGSEDPDPTCTGAPTACEELDADSCSEVAGCSAAVCTGVAAACLTAESEAECEEADATCTWSTEASCGGIIPCQIFAGAEACNAHPACTWVPAINLCQGVLYCPEAAETESECDEYSPCVWRVPSCHGTPTPCEGLSIDECTAQPGCELN